MARTKKNLEAPEPHPKDTGAGTHPPTFPWHRAHFFIALLLVRCVVLLSPPIGGFKSSRKISLRRSEQRFHMFRADLIPPLGDDENPVRVFALRVALLWGRGLGNPHGLVCEQRCC